MEFEVSNVYFHCLSGLGPPAKISNEQHSNPPERKIAGSNPDKGPKVNFTFLWNSEIPVFANDLDGRGRPLGMLYPYHMRHRRPSTATGLSRHRVSFIFSIWFLGFREVTAEAEDRGFKSR